MKFRWFSCHIQNKHPNVRTRNGGKCCRVYKMAPLAETSFRRGAEVLLFCELGVIAKTEITYTENSPGCRRKVNYKGILLRCFLYVMLKVYTGCSCYRLFFLKPLQILNWSFYVFEVIAQQGINTWLTQTLNLFQKYKCNWVTVGVILNAWRSCYAHTCPSSLSITRWPSN